GPEHVLAVGPSGRHAPIATRAAGEVAPTGARLVSTIPVAGVVVRPFRGALAAALDAAAHRAIARVDAAEATATWTSVAANAIALPAWSCALFAGVVHVAGPSASPSDGALAALAALVGASTSAFLVAAPAARVIAIARARAAGVAIRDPAALDALADADVA